MDQDDSFMDLMIGSHKRFLIARSILLGPNFPCLNKGIVLCDGAYLTLQHSGAGSGRLGVQSQSGLFPRRCLNNTKHSPVKYAY